MSATNRGGQRCEADNYPTPAWCARRLLDEVALPGGRWLEPAAGDCAIIRAIPCRGRDWTAVEVRRECEPTIDARRAMRLYTWHAADYLALPPPAERFEVAITNPPYSLAQPFIDKMLAEAWVVVALLRLNYLASERRAAFMREHRPSVYVLPNRPSFSPDGHTDACEYAWFVFGTEPRGEVRVLAPTPAAERRGR